MMREEHNPEIASPASPTEKWKLSPQAWSRFLARLDQDSEKAGEQYEELRKRLATFFRCRGFFNPEELVDRAIDRVIRALDMGEEIRNLFAYAYTVVKFVALEEYREPKKISLDGMREPAANSPEDPEKEHRVAIQSECIRCCSSALSPVDFELVNEWYQHDKSEKADHKLMLAAKRGVSIGTLRTQASRLRTTIRKCAQTCAEKSGVTFREFTH